MKLMHDQRLADYTSLRVGGMADRMMILEEHDQLANAVKAAEGDGPIWILGFGTNCLISDKGLPGTVILNRAGQLDRLDDTHFKVESGVDWDNLVQAVISSNLWGIECTSGVPGGVGAAIVGNIAAYGQQVADVFVEATLLDSTDGSTTVWHKEDLGFSYRTSVLQKPEHSKLIILDATFEFATEPSKDLEYESALKTARELGMQPDSLANRRKIIMETRRRAGSLQQDHSVGPWTAGSFFKNPMVDETQVQAIVAHEEAGITPEQLLRQNQLHGGDKARVSAAHVLLAAGFHRGQTWDNVRLHPDHILKVENLGQASAKEMYDVVQHILATVRDKLSIELEPEVRFLGEF